MAAPGAASRTGSAYPGFLAEHGFDTVFAGSIGVVPDPFVVTWVALAVEAGVLVLANLLALGPALGSARLWPGELLRTQ